MEQKYPNIESITSDVIDLLKELIEIPSYSREEDNTATHIERFLAKYDVKTNRSGNNIWAFNKFYDTSKPTILLNSHHDTVKPNKNYTKDPFTATVIDGTLYGLGSNDAGGPLVTLIAVFLYYYSQENLIYNLIIAPTAEEEISGINGVESILVQLGKIDFAIIGEPTQMQLAIAEKGLLILDCEASGTASHAAHHNPDNAILNALKDILWVKDFKFPKISDQLGEVKMTTTIINAGEQHNVVPNTCTFTIDIRTTDSYTNQEVLDIVSQNLKSTVNARSLRLNPSSISLNNPFVASGINHKLSYYGSPTCSDQAVIPVPSLKMGPGDSSRSHTADEYIHISEIEEGIKIYLDIFNSIMYKQ